MNIQLKMYEVGINPVLSLLEKLTILRHFRYLNCRLAELPG
jgi:hypothetical protein